MGTWNDERVGSLRRLVALGRSENEIGRELGLTRGAVGRKIRRDGLGRLRPAQLVPRARKPSPAPMPPPIQTPPLSVRLIDATPNQCRWISSAVEQANADTCVCGLPIYRGSWCKYHHAIGHVPRPQLLRPSYA